MKMMTEWSPLKLYLIKLKKVKVVLADVLPLKFLEIREVYFHETVGQPFKVNIALWNWTCFKINANMENASIAV